MKKLKSKNLKVINGLSVILLLALFSCSEEINYLESGDLVTDENTFGLVTPVDPFTVSDVEFLSIGDTEAKVQFTTSAISKAYIDYGGDSNYGEQNTGDFSLENVIHRQDITALEPATTYLFKIVAFNEAGEQATASGTFTTANNGDGTSTLPFTVSDVEILDLVDTESRIKFTASANAQAYIEYGTGTDYGSTTNKEVSFNYATHRQRIRNLEPGTTYYYRVRANSESWQTASAAGSFTTIAGPEGGDGDGESGDSPITPVNGWNDDLPYGGRAIGVVTSGITTGNSSITKHKSARRFLATRTGPVRGFGYQNRMLTDQNVRERAAAGREKYIEMMAAVGADGARGGYMLGNSYAVGNGGLQEVSLQTDRNGLPSGEILAIAPPYIPKERVENGWRIEDFKSTTNIQAGQLYWLVFENLNPPSTDITNLSASEAKNAPTNAGAISLNGPKKGDMIDPDEPLGPFLRDFGKLVIKKSASDSWRSSDVVPFMSIVYTDGIEVGETYSHLQGQSDFRYEVDGNKALRQQFTWKYDDISVDRVVTRFGHTDNANGKPMDITIKNASGTTLATSQVEHDPELKTAAKSSDYWRERQTRHSVGSLSNVVDLQKNQKYYVEYTADSGAGFVMAPAGIGAAEGTSDRHIWEDANAEQSSNGGSNWESLNKFTDWDMPMYLIPVGVPTRTPNP